MIVLRFALAFVRMLLFVLVAVIVYALILLTNLFSNDRDKKLHRAIVIRRAIIRFILKILGTKVTVYGEEFTQSGLIVFNHRSYFDPVVILKNILAYPVGKKEVQSWPIIGNVAKSTGVIFVKRESRASRKDTLKKMRTVLEKGYSILIAPEGTTHINPTTMAFKPGGFIIAAQLGVPILPIALDYKDINDAWIDDDTFIPHFFKCFGKWHTEIKISYLQPIFSDDVDTLITQSKKAIDAEMLRFRKEWEAEK
ncbi:MAG: 1-acyl-sn-glycerol-3-phosphate acyltransferase [Flavobacteriaceae bacterium]|nr:1-acyl-sn-glycerol-3-phosphate acyltransferase [Flavobacteriaceae bacterium]